MPVDLTDVEIAAWVFDGDLKLQKIDGTGSADGTFTLDGEVPEGAYYLELQPSGGAPSFTVTSSRTPSIERYLLGRPDATNAAPGTLLVFDVTGLNPWKPEDDTVLFSSNAGAIAFSPHLDATVGAPMAGDTALTGMTVDASVVYTGGLNPAAHLIEGSKGDVAHFFQLVHKMDPAGPYFVLEKHCSPAPFDQKNGASTALSCALADVAPAKSFVINVDRASFEGQLANVHPTSFVHETEVVLRALPSVTAHGLYSGSPELIIFESNPGAGDITATIGYGNPFPATWDVFASYLTAFYVPVLAPGASTPIELHLFLRSDLPIDAVDGSARKPPLTPVTEMKVNGLDAFKAQTGVTTSPTLTWKAPSTGVVERYDLIVQRIYNQGGATKQSVVGRFTTAEAGVTIPPDVLKPGESYVVQVIASTGSSLPAGAAPAVSSLLSP